VLSRYVELIGSDPFFGVAVTYDSCGGPRADRAGVEADGTTLRATKKRTRRARACMYNAGEVARPVRLMESFPLGGGLGQRRWPHGSAQAIRLFHQWRAGMGFYGSFPTLSAATLLRYRAGQGCRVVRHVCDVLSRAIGGSAADQR